MELVELLSKVNDRPTLVAFLTELEVDFTSDHDRWENWTVNAYIGAISSWLESEGDIRVPESNPDLAIRNQWHFLATCLYVGKLQE